MKIIHINKDTMVEIIKKLLYEIDYNKTYIIEFSQDMNVDISELEVVEDRFEKLLILKTDKTLYYKKND